MQAFSKLFKPANQIMNMADNFYKQLGTGISSITFGISLSVFVYAAAVGLVTGLQAGLLFATSLLLVLRFWWRYNELFVRLLPSSSFWHFLLDFAVSFFAIAAVLTINDLSMWAMVGMFAMLASSIRCTLSWHNAKSAKHKLKRTFAGSAAMFAVFWVLYVASQFISGVYLAAAAFVVALALVVYSSRD